MAEAEKAPWETAPPIQEQAPWETAPPPPPQPGLGSKALGLLSAVGKKIDSYTGAPTRSAIGAAQDYSKGGDPIAAFKNQFGEDPAKAPTGQDVMSTAGVPDEQKSVMTAKQHEFFDKANNPGDYQLRKDSKTWPYTNTRLETPAEYLGKGVDLAADPINLIPLAGEAKGLLNGERLAEPISKGLKGFAEKAAVNATGATGNQAAKFAPNAGRELLDQGIVKFGSSQAGIAKRAANAVAEAEKQISSALEPLQKSGVTIDRNDIYNAIKDKINTLKGDESQADVVRALEGKLNDVVAAADSNGAKVGVLDAENIKRGFGSKIRNWADPSAGAANKELYDIFRGSVEKSAQTANPALAQTFEEGKKAYGLMDPIAEAAERRAGLDAQSPYGGFRDLVSADAGERAFGKLGLIAPLVRRVVMPRIASSAAVSADKVADLIKLLPKGVPLVPASGLSTGDENLDQNQTRGLLRLSKASAKVQ